MALPPFNLDINNPADNGVVSQFPANERVHRDEVFSYLNVEHDSTAGYHKFQLLTTTQKGALSSPPSGMIVYDTTLGELEINTGTSSSPVWATIGAKTGDIKIWPTATAPVGWLNCDGSAVSRTTYAALFALIGTTFGSGDGTTTFNLPNFQRCVPVGAGGTGTAVLGNAVGNRGGEETHTLTVAELAAHTHANTLNDPGHGHTLYGNMANFDVGTVWETGGTAGPHSLGGTALPATTGMTITNASAGSGTPFNVVQPSLVVNFIVKT